MKPPIADPFENSSHRVSIPAVASPLDWDERQQCFFVPYRSPFVGRLRCLPKEICLLPIQIVFFFVFTPLPLIWMSGLSWPFALKLGVAAAGSVAWMLLMMFLQFAGGKNRPLSKMKITADGLVDEMPDKTRIYSWSEIKRMRNWKGDLFFLVGPLKGSYFCRESFRSPEEADQFYGMAEKLWQSQGAQWPEIVRQFSTRLKP